MKHIFHYDDTTAGLRLLTLCFALTFAGSISVRAQDNHDDHEGHDHAEEAEHGETHEEHVEHEDHDEHADHDEHGGPIRLEARDMQEFGIRIATAGAGAIHEELRLPGEVRMNENTMGHVSPRFDGVVSELLHRLGDEVNAGDVLARMESNETLRPFDLVAPLDGTIVDYHITAGESLSAGDMAYTIADTTTVWVDLRVYQRDLPKVHKGQKVRVSVGHEYPEMEGTVSYVGPIVDEISRTGLIRVVLPNRNELLRPGLFVVGQVLLDEHLLPVVVPRAAVHTVDEAEVIFVQAEAEEGYEARPVRLGRGDSENVEIVDGLEPGQRYVSEGGFFLKADSQKEDFGDGHNH